MRTHTEIDHLFSRIIIFVTGLCLLFTAGLMAHPYLQSAGHSPLPFGQLVLALHEGDPGYEAVTADQIGALTMRTAAALQQKAGIIVMSPAIWHNLHHRRFAFSQSAQHIGSAHHTLAHAWQEVQKESFSEKVNTLKAAAKASPNTLHTLFVWQLSLIEKEWQSWLHKPSGMIVMIPQQYIDQRAPLLPRLMPAGNNIIEYATGLNLKECEPVYLPQLAEEKKMRKLLAHAKRIRIKYEFSIPNLASLFLKHEDLPPVFKTSWHIYAMGHGFLKTTRKEWEHLDDKPKALPEKNKRGETHEMCGLALNDFRALLQMFNQSIDTDFFYFQSCYGGGQHLAQLYRHNTYDRRIVGEQLSLSYPLVAGALAAAPVTVLMPRYREKALGGFELMIDTDLPRFFELLSDDSSSLESVLQAITPPVPTTQDLHAISATPLLLAPHTSSFIPIDVTRGAEPNRPHATRAGIMHVSHAEVQKSREENRPIIVRGKRAALISPFRVPAELEIHAYHTPSHIARSLPQLPPALISVVPGNAIHHFNAITTHDIGLRSFLLHSCMQLMGHQSTKVYLIDRLRVENDLATNFDDAKPHSMLSSWWHTIQGWFTSKAAPLSTPRITLNNVIVYVRNNRLNCYFIEPLTNDESRARQVTYRAEKTDSTESISNSMRNDSIRLSIATQWRRSHDSLYKKYRALFAKQTLDDEISALHLAPLATTIWRRTK